MDVLLYEDYLSESVLTRTSVNINVSEHDPWERDARLLGGKAAVKLPCLVRVEDDVIVDVADLSEESDVLRAIFRRGDVLVWVHASGTPKDGWERALAAIGEDAVEVNADQVPEVWEAPWKYHALPALMYVDSDSTVHLMRGDACSAEDVVDFWQQVCPRRVKAAA